MLKHLLEVALNWQSNILITLPYISPFTASEREWKNWSRTSNDWFLSHTISCSYSEEVTWRKQRQQQQIKSYSVTSRWPWNWLRWSENGTNNTKLTCSIPVWSTPWRAGLSDPCGLLPTQTILWFFVSPRVECLSVWHQREGRKVATVQLLPSICHAEKLLLFVRW